MSEVKKNVNMYYDINPLLSHNAMINFVLGERGNGKTWAGKSRMLDLFLKKGKQSIYVRRYENEIDKVKHKLFNDILKEYPGIDFKIIGNEAYIEGKIFCYFIALSTSMKMKSSSFPDVDFIFFDEYIITKSVNNRYLPDEVNLIYELISTVFRDRTPRVYICSNAVSYSNPIFEDLGIYQKFKNRFLKFYADDRSIDICIEFTDTVEFREHMKKTRFGKFVSTREYGKYAIENNALYDTKDFIIPKRPLGYDLCFSKFILDSGAKFYMWIKFDFDKNYYFSSEGSDNAVILNITLGDLKEGYKPIQALMWNSKGKNLKDSILFSRVGYENTHIKNYVMEHLLPQLKRY